MFENNDNLKDVALRIRNAREDLGVTQEIMAKNTDVSLKDYIAYENGEKDMDFTFIYKCAKCFNVDPTDLLKGTSPRLTSFEVTKHGGGLPIARKAGNEYKNLAAMFKNKTTEPFHVIIPYVENDDSHDFSSHKGQEFDIVISGQLKITVGNNTQILEAGDTIYYNSTIPTSQRLMAEKTLKYMRWL